MKIAIAFASSSGQISGVQRHAINLARCLLKLDAITEVHLIAAPWQLEFALDLLSDLIAASEGRLHLHAAPIGNSALSRNTWFYAQLPALARRLGVDILHLAYPVPTAPKAVHCPIVVTLHDLYPYDIPGNFGFPKVLFNRAVLQQCLRSVDAIACVSQSTRTRLNELMPKLHAKSSVVYNTVEPLPPEAHLQGAFRGMESKPFLLCVAQHRRNKNILLVLRIFKRLLQACDHNHSAFSLRLVIVGIPGPETAAIEHFISTAGLASSVMLLHGISDAQLHWCYTHCTALLAPSTLEGFGLPVAEALLAGCHVVCSDIPAFRELGSAQCRYITLDMHAEQAFASALLALVDAGRPAPIHLPQLSSTVIARAYLDLYQSLLPAAQACSQRPLYIAEQGRRTQ